MTISEVILFFLTLFLGILTIINFFVARKKDNTQTGTEQGALQADISFIKNLLIEVRADTKEINKILNAHAVDIADIKSSVKSAHKRIDEALERIEKIELIRGGN